MNNNQKLFNLFVFLSTFARNLIELYVPIMLFKFGYDLKSILLYYLFMNMFSILLTKPCFSISKRFNSKVLFGLSIVFFIMMQISLANITYSIYYLALIALLYALYRRCYWIPRRYYNMIVIEQKDISKTYSITSIINQIGVVTSAYIGSYLLDNYSTTLVTSIAMILFFIGIIPLFFMKFEHEKNNEKLSLFKTFKKIPKEDLYIFGAYELSNVVKFLFPLYLFMYVKSNYQIVGIFNLISNLSIMLFVYLYGKKINDKKNYLKLSIFCICLIYVLKASITIGSILVIIVFLEGFFAKMYELSISKEFYALSKKYEYLNYNYVYEYTQNILRFCVVLFLFVFNDIRYMIIVTVLFMFVSIFLSFDREERKRRFKFKD